MKTCPSCGATVADIAKFCGACGKEIRTPSALVCKVCGSEVGPKDRFCPGCGLDMAASGSSGSLAQPRSYSAQPLVSQYSNDQTPPSMYGPQAQSTLFPSGVKCRNCGYALAPGQIKCQFCGSKVLSYHRKDWSGAAGGLIITTGLLNVLFYGVLAVGSLIGDFSIATRMTFILLTAINVFAMWAGMQALKRRRYGICLIGAAVTMLSFLFFISIVAMVFLALSKEAFQKEQPPATGPWGTRL
jgi:RNA polymerase subunit RPABC4/transcription elongation factor Spt4